MSSITPIPDGAGPAPAAATPATIEAVRRRRAELRDSMDAVEQALAAPAGATDWARAVREAVQRLRADIAEHVVVTEGPDGLYREVLSVSPRLAHAVQRLTGEHAEMVAHVEEVVARVDALAPVDEIREAATQLLGRLARHRQRGADLVYEAYDLDVGGET